MSNVKKSKRCQEAQKMSKSPKDVKKSKRCQEVQKMSKSPKDIKSPKDVTIMSEPHCIKLKFYESILEYSTYRV